MKISKKTKRCLLIYSTLILLIGAIGTYYLLNTSSKSEDVINLLFFPHLLSLYIQPVFLLIVLKEMLLFSKIRDLLTIRGMSLIVFKYLLSLIIFDTALFFGVIIATCFIRGYTISFTLGNPLIGMMIIILHIMFLLLLEVILLSSYQVESYSYFIFIGTIIMNLLFHYYLEIPIIMPKYSVYFDYFYRVVHHLSN